MFIDNICADIITILNLKYDNLVIVAVVFGFLTAATITDLKYFKIPNKLNLIFFIIRLILIPIIGFSVNDVLGALIGFLVLFIPAMIRNHKMGGDIKCMTVLGLFLGLNMPIFIGIMCVLGIIIFSFNVFILGKKGNMPFAPIFLLAHISLTIIALIL